MLSHYKIEFFNPHFYIADASVNALIKMLKRIDPVLKFSRGKVGNTHYIYFDSEISDWKLFHDSIKEFIKNKKYEFHQFTLVKTKLSGVSESLFNLISFDNFKSI